MELLQHELAPVNPHYQPITVVKEIRKDLEQHASD